MKPDPRLSELLETLIAKWREKSDALGREANADYHHDKYRSAYCDGKSMGIVHCLTELRAAVLLGGTPQPALFQRGNFLLHGGEQSDWKIDCDALSDADIATLARIVAIHIGPFGAVEGVPRGGLRLAEALHPSVTIGPLLIVDDVLTTGGSMDAQRAGREAIGAVIFARGECPSWIMPMFTFSPRPAAAAQME